MNERKYTYDIIVGPNPLDDSITPITLLDDFVASTDQKNKMKKFLSEFDENYVMKTREIITSKPKFRKRNGLTSPTSTHDSIVVQAKMWQQAIVYGVIVDATSADLLSVQIAEGYNADNIKVDPEHYSFGTTDSKGKINLNFTLLEGKKKYKVYVTAESVVPYTPRIRLSDSQTKFI